MTQPVTEAAAVLANLRRTVATIDALDEAIAPQSVPEAYQVQDGLIAELGGKIVAWKVGATAEAVQAKLGVDEPFSGPIFASALHRAPASLSAANYTHRLIECEFAFRLGDDLAPRPGAPYSLDEVKAAVDATCPAIEIIAPSFDVAIGGSAHSRIADLGVSAGLVVGEAVTDWRALDLAEHPVTLRVDGAEVATGTGGLVLGHPLNSLHWLANHMTMRGRTLSAGMVVTTGTTTGLYDLAVGAEAVADFGALGAVSLSFTA